MSKFLLREFHALCEGGICQDLLTEAEKIQVNNGAMILTGVMQVADVKNGNGRIYPLDVLKREIQNYMKLVREKRSLGELDHPEDSVINLKNSSHMVTNLWFDGNKVMGKIKILDTPAGEIARALVDSEVQLGISSRGLGSVRETKEGTMVEHDFQLICFDLVSEPSSPGAFMHLRESKHREPNIFTKADKINRILNSIIKE